jgi:hypothetical protein
MLYTYTYVPTIVSPQGLGMYCTDFFSGAEKISVETRKEKSPSDKTIGDGGVLCTEIELRIHATHSLPHPLPMKQSRRSTRLSTHEFTANSPHSSEQKISKLRAQETDGHQAAKPGGKKRKRRGKSRWFGLAGRRSKRLKTATEIQLLGDPLEVVSGTTISKQGSVLRIWIRMFFGPWFRIRICYSEVRIRILPSSSKSRGTDTDPSIIKQK